MRLKSTFAEQYTFNKSLYSIKKTVYTIKYKPQIKCFRIYMKNFEKDF